MTQAIVWGVEDTLIHIPAHITEIFPQRVADAVGEILPHTKIDTGDIKGMARAEFNRSGTWCKDAAAAYAIDEGVLTSHAHHLVARQDVWPRQSHFARGNQHWLNLFEDSQSLAAPVKHFAVTSGSGEWGGRVTLQAVGLSRFMTGIAGSEIIRKLHGEVASRIDAGAPVIAWLTEGLRPQDVVVADRSADYVEKARAAGFQGVQIGEGMSVADVFERKLGITADSRRRSGDRQWPGYNADAMAAKLAL